MTAQDMGRKRWKGVGRKKRLAHSQAMNARKMEVTTPEQRSLVAKKAAAARWSKKKKGEKKGGSKTV